MKKEQQEEILGIINQIEEQIRDLPDYEEFHTVNERLDSLDTKVDKILEKLNQM